MISEKQKQIILDVVHPYRPKMVGIFGSYARSEEQDHSDLDILIDFEETVNLLDLIDLEYQLSEILNVRVDLVTQRSVSKLLEPFIQKDLIRIN